VPRCEVTVVVPTRGLAERAQSLRCAIDSIASQHRVRAIPLVVLNGPDADPAVRRALHDDPRVRMMVRDDASLPDAMLAGRRAVDTAWFASLDDDDHLVPGALALRVSALERDAERVVVVTNGYRHERGAMVPHLPLGCAPDVNADPLRTLLRRNWLLPGSWLCRTEHVGASLFEGMPRYLECTWLALRFALDGRMLWLDTPTVVYHVGSPAAESLSSAYVRGQMHALRQLLALPLPDDVRDALRGRIAAAYHDASLSSLRDGALVDAWRHHARSLLERGGWRFLPFTRHLARASLRAATS
jgi:hypothetical protein